jgi:hypothetical protein
MSLNSFIDQSKTFNGFVFNGMYTMPDEIFLRLFDHYQKTGENYLDVYSELQYLFWESKKPEGYTHDYIECEKYERYISISRRLKLFNVDEILEIRQYVRKCWFKYRDYLDHLKNEPRRKACRFTAMPEVKKYIFTKYGKKCLCCGSIDKISLDHIIPVQKGGKDEVENLQPLCKSCNSKKNIQIIDYRK